MQEKQGAGPQKLNRSLEDIEYKDRIDTMSREKKAWECLLCFGAEKQHLAWMCASERSSWK